MHPLRCLYEHLPGLSPQCGLSYGATYSGPIGLFIDPTFNARKYSNLPSPRRSMQLTNVCPVKIKHPRAVYAWRACSWSARSAAGKEGAMKAAGHCCRSPLPIAPRSLSPMRPSPSARFVIYNGLNAWGASRGAMRPNKPSTAGTTRTGERSDEQPRRYPGFDPKQPASSGRPLPLVPAFDDDPPVSLLDTSRTICTDGRRILDPSALRRHPGASPDKDPGAKVVCSQAGDHGTGRSPTWMRRGIWRMSICHRPSSFGVAETGSVS